MGLLVNALEDGNTEMSMRILKRVSDQANCKPKQQIAEGSTHSADIIESGDFELNLAQRTTTVCGRELRLTSDEFDVLVFLYRHPQRLVTQYTMLATNCSVNGTRQTAFLTSLISLRNKIDAVGTGKHYLQN
jgi:DNA-binding response OmpR family regulator